jgi:hypothetical protein
MADLEAVAATLAAAILQSRVTREVGQAQILVTKGQADPSRLAGDPHEVPKTVDLYLQVLAELQSVPRKGSP